MYMSMNSGALALTTGTAPIRVSGARVFLLEAHSEFLRLLRAPSFCVPTIAFPLMFYLLFGIFLAPVHAHRGRRPRSARQLPGDRLHGARPVRARHHARQ